MQTHSAVIGVALYDDSVGKISYRLAYSAGSGKIDLTVIGDVNSLENSNVNLSQVAIAQVLCHEREVQVAVLHFLAIDGRAHGWIGDKRRTETYCLGARKHAVDGIAGRGSRIEIYFKRFACCMCLFGTFSNLGKHSLWGSRQRKATDTHTIAVVDMACSLGGCHNAITHSSSFYVCLFQVPCGTDNQYFLLKISEYMNAFFASDLLPRRTKRSPVACFSSFLSKAASSAATGRTGCGCG